MNGKGAIGPGPVIDVAGVPFNVDVSGGDLSANTDWFRVEKETFEARDVDGDCIWLSESIDISSYTEVDISMVISEVGDHEASDFVDVEYLLDGSPTLITNWNGLGSATHTLIGDIPNDSDWGTETVTATNLMGSTLQIRVTMNNGAGTEFLQLDDIVVTESGVAPVVADIQITEVHYNPDDAGGYLDADYEFIELYNAETTAVDLSDYTFTQGIVYTFPAATSIAAGEFIIVCANSATYSGNGYQVFQWTSGALNNDGELIQIQDASSNTVNQITYGDVSPWPFQADGYGPSIELTTLGTDNNNGANWHSYNCQGQPTPNGTPGAANSTPGIGCTNPGALNFDFCAFIDDASCTFPVFDVVINEFHYNPCTEQGNDTDYEFIEIYNFGASAIDIGDWQIANAVDFTFPTGTTIAAGEYIVVAVNAATYSGNGYQVFEWTTGGINNSGETIELLNDGGATVDELTYDDGPTWPVTADGSCVSVELVDPTSDNSDASNWQPSFIFGGTPGAVNSTMQDCGDCGVGATVNSFISDDFEDGDISDWVITSGADWAANGLVGINGSFSLDHAGAAGTSSVSYDMNCLNADAACTTWSFDMMSDAWDVTANNNFSVFLVANDADLTSATVDGVAFGANLNADASGNLALYNVSNGAIAGTILTYPYAWPQNGFISVEINYTENGMWVVKVDTDGGSDLLLTGGPAVASVNPVEGQYFGILYNCDAVAATGIRFDDINVSQCGVSETYYSVASGNLTDAIWNTDTNGATGEAVTFSKFKNMVVRNGQTVSFDADFTVNDLTVDATNGAGVVNAGSGNATLAGNFTNDGGTVNAETSTFIFKGDAAQSIGGTSSTTFENMTMKNALGLSLGVNTSIHGVLSPEEGAFTTGANVLTLASDAMGTGSVGEILASASFAGTVNAQRYIPVGETMWVNVCSPIAGLTLADWNDDLITTGFTNSDFPDYAFDDGTLFNNVLQYDETAAGMLNDGFVGATDITDGLDATRGYFVYMQNLSQLVDVEGAIQQGSLTTNLNYTSTGVAANDGWELVANRYPSEIDFDALHALSTGIAPTYYVFDAENFVYTSYTVGVGGTATGFIPSGQSFWVQTTAAGAALQFEESMKSNVGSAFERDFPGLSKIALQLERNGLKHVTTVVLEEDASIDFEPGKDAFVLGSVSDSAPLIAAVATDGELTAVNRISLENVTSIPVHVKAVAGSFTFRVIDAEYIPEGVCMSIEDLETGEFFPFEENVEISWEQAEDFEGIRFMLHLTKPIETAVNHISCHGANDGQITIDSFVSTGTVEVYNLDGVLIDSADIAENVTFENLAQGDYQIVYTDADGACAQVSAWVYVEQPNAISISTPLSIDLDLVEEVVTTTVQADVANAELVTWYVDGMYVGEGVELDLNFYETGTYIVTAEASNGVCYQSAQTVITVVGGNTIEELTSTITAFMVGSQLQVQSSGMTYTDLSIFDATGKIVAQFNLGATNGTSTVDLSTLAHGSYTVIISNNGIQIEAVRFVK